jgi:hypothetical protein
LDGARASGGLDSVVLRLGRWFSPSSIPFMSRPAYRREITSTFFFAFALAAVEGGIVSVFTKNAFAGIVESSTLNLMVGLVQAAPELSNVLSFFWAEASAGRRKVPFINGLQLAVLVLIVAGSLVPRTETGLYVFVGLVIFSRVCWSGIVTLRTGVWRANYSRRDRAGIVGRFSTIQVLTVAIVGLVLGRVLDFRPGAYLYLAPLACVLGLAALVSYRRIRVRGEKKWLREEVGGEAAPAAGAAGSQSSQASPPSLSSARGGWGWRGPFTVVRVLRSDPVYAEFQVCMFTLGLGNLMLAALMAILLRDRFGLGYLQGIAITTSVPAAVMVAAIPAWARLLDRAHVVRFRSIHSWVFVASQGLILVATLAQKVELMYFGAVVQGIAMGGGTLAWNLGHHDFAPASRTSQYMAVHVTLNGVRGLMAPFLAVGLYEALRGADVRPFNMDPSSTVQVVSLFLCVLGAVGFVRLRIKMRETVRAFRR